MFYGSMFFSLMAFPLSDTSWTLFYNTTFYLINYTSIEITIEISSTMDSKVSRFDFFWLIFCLELFEVKRLQRIFRIIDNLEQTNHNYILHVHCVGWKAHIIITVIITRISNIFNFNSMSFCYRIIYDGYFTST